MLFGRRRKEALDRLEDLISGEATEKDAAALAVILARGGAELEPLAKAGRLVGAAGSEIAPTDHLSNNEIAEYIGGACTGAALARREAHLATCDECRAVFVKAGAAYRIYADTIRPPWQRVLRGLLRPIGLGILPGVFLGIYLLGYFLTPFDPPWVAPLVNSPWIVVFGILSAILSLWLLLRRNW